MTDRTALHALSAVQRTPGAVGFLRIHAERLGNGLPERNEIDLAWGGCAAMRARSCGPAAAARTARASPARPEPRRRWRPRARGSRRNRWPPSASRWSGWSRPDPWFRCWPRRACCRRNRLAPGRVGNGLLPGGLTAADRLLRRVLGDRLLVRR